MRKNKQPGENRHPFRKKNCNVPSLELNQGKTKKKKKKKKCCEHLKAKELSIALAVADLEAVRLTPPLGPNYFNLMWKFMIYQVKSPLGRFENPGSSPAWAGKLLVLVFFVNDANC